MEKTVEVVVEALRREPTYTLPVSALHGMLIAESGRGPASYGELTATLAEHPDLFVVMEPTDPLGPARGWSPQLRSEYYAELRAAGFAPEPRVALLASGAERETREEPADVGDGLPPLASVDATLVWLWVAEATAEPLRATIAAALAELAEIRRVLAQVV